MNMGCEPSKDRNILGKGIGPSLTHSASLSALEAATSAATSQAVGDAVSVLVCDDIVLDSTVTSLNRQSGSVVPRASEKETYWAGKVPQVHVHVSTLAIGRRGEVGVVLVVRVLYLNSDTVIALAAVTVVVGLEADTEEISDWGYHDDETTAYLYADSVKPYLYEISWIELTI